MPYEPTFPHPYLEAIDVAVEGGNNFQCVINPRDKITAYKISISSVENGTEVCSIEGATTDTQQFKYYSIAGGNKTQIADIPTSDSLLPFQGKANSDDSIFMVNIPSILTTENALVNGKEYFWSIELTNDSGSVTSKDFYFTSAATPRVILDIPSVVTSNRVNLSATYSQSENLLPAYYRFALYNKAKEIYTTDDIFSSDIVFEYDKLISGEDYELELTVVLDSGMEITESYFFSVSYKEAGGLLFSTVEVNNKDTYVSIDYSQQVNIDGVLEGSGAVIFAKAKNEEEDFPETPNIMILNDNQSVYWNKAGRNLLDFENSNQVIHWHAHDRFDGTILEKIDESDGRRNISVSFSDGVFSYTEGQKAPKYHYLYKSDASAIAGDDGHSTVGTVLDYSEDTPSITLENSSLITEGARIQIGEEFRTVTSVEVGDAYIVATLDSPFDIIPISNSNKYAIYSKDYHYILTDNSAMENSDILLWNDFTPENWYYICLTPNGVEYIEDPNTVEILREVV